MFWGLFGKPANPTPNSNPPTRDIGSYSETIDRVIMRRVMAILGYRITDLSIWLSGDYSPSARVRLDIFQAEINKLKDWAKLLDDKTIRKSYLGWLDYYQRGLDSAYRELITKDIFTRQASFRERLDLEWEKVYLLEQDMVIPSPPTPIRTPH